MSVRAIFLFGLALAACTTFPTIDRNICGNGIVEPGEDCDSTAATCVACAITCGAIADCPKGYACGVDKTCHAPGGQLGEVRTIDNVAVNDFRITDVDKDGIGDFVGLSSTSLTVRHGDAAASFLAHESFVTPAQTGAPAFGDLDHDGAIDFILPTQDGLVTYTSKYGEPSAIPIPASVIDKTVEIVSLVSLRARVIGIFLAPLPTAMVPNPDVQLWILDFADPTTPAGVAVTLCDAHTPAATFDPASIDLYDASGSSNADYILSFLSGPTGGRRVCVLNIDVVPPAGSRKVITAIVTPVTPPGVTIVSTRPVLAQLDSASGDRCPNLLISDNGPKNILGYDSVLAPAAGSLPQRCVFGPNLANQNPLHISLPGAGDNDTVIGRVPLVPQFFLVGGDAMLTQSGLWGYVPLVKTAAQVYASTRPIRGVVTGDINHDGLTDAVLIPDGEDDLDLLIRYHDGNVTPAIDGYRFLRIDTATQAGNVVLQDFDGNGFLDVAYTEHVGDHERMMIAFGTPDLLLPPVQVATFDKVGAVVSIELPSYEDPLSLAADLLVTVPNASPPLLTILLGSPQRTMTPLLDPRHGPDAGCAAIDTVADTIFRAAVIGDFAHDTTTPQYPDAIAMASLRPGHGTATTGCTAVPNVLGWRIPGNAVGFDTTGSPGKRVMGLVECNNASAPTSMNEMCTSASYLAVPTTAGHDVVLGIDRYNHATLADPSSGSFTLTPITAFKTLAGDAVVTTLLAADLDGDGRPELVASFRSGATSPGLVLWCALDPATGKPGTCVDVGKDIAAVTGSAEDCGAVAAGRYLRRGAPATGLDLVVACHESGATSLYRVRADHTVATLATKLPGLTELVRSGDINGDGVDDLVLVQGEVGAQALQVMTQCTTRDAACLQEAP